VKSLFLVQEYRDEKWQTISVSTYEGDAEETWEILTEWPITTRPVRQCRLQVTDLDFLMVYARDVEVQRRTG
jgi:hypothetical protein